MKTKLITALTALALSSTLMYAYNSPQCPNMECGKKEKMMKHHKKFDKSGHVVKMIMGLDLSSEQRSKIHSIMREHRQSESKISDAFTEAEFSESKYMQILEEKKANRAQRKAKLISKVYAILTPEQKKELKNRLDNPRPKRAMYEK
jgi:protein CpxP